MRSSRMRLSVSDCSFTQRVLNIHRGGLQRCLVAWLVPRETAAVSAQVLCIPYIYAPVYNVTLFETAYVG